MATKTLNDRKTTAEKVIKAKVTAEGIKELKDRVDGLSKTPRVALKVWA